MRVLSWVEIQFTILDDHQAKRSNGSKPIATLKLPDKADQHLQYLMDRNHERKRTDQERVDLAALAELSESLSLVRAEALDLSGRKPQTSSLWPMSLASCFSNGW